MFNTLLHTLLALVCLATSLAVGCIVGIGTVVLLIHGLGFPDNNLTGIVAAIPGILCSIWIMEKMFSRFYIL